MLLVRPHPREAESLRGYLLRLSTANGLQSPDPIEVSWADELAFGAPRRCWPRGPMTGHSHLARPDAGGLASRFWNNRRPRYCPQCLVEDQTWLSLWELVFVTECPRHRIELLDECVSCRRPLRWRRAELVRCACGAEFAGASGERSAPDALAVSSELARVWNEGSDEDGLSNGLSIEELLHRTWFLGAYASRSASRALKLGNLFDVRVARRIASAAHLPSEDWLPSLFSLLDQVAGHYGRSESMRLTERFGAMYKELFDPSSDRALRDVREGFERYVEARWPGQLAARNTRLSCEVRNRHSWVPLTQAAARLHWKLPRLRSAIERGVVRGHITQHKSGRSSGTVHREDLARLMDESSDEMTLLDVCACLRMGKKAIKALVSANELHPTSGPTIDQCTIWRFRRIEVESLAIGGRNSSQHALAHPP